MTALAALAVVAFLQNGEVWTSPEGADGTIRQATHTGGRVEDFRYSVDGQYLAYARRIRDAAERPVAAIVVMRVATGTILAELQPDDGWLDIDRWLGSVLVYHASSGLDVSGIYEYDAVRGARRELDPARTSPNDRDVSKDGRLSVYVDDTGLGPVFRQRLHVVDVRTGADVVRASKRSVMAPAISPSTAAVAFVEVVDAPPNGTPGLDRVWISRSDGSEAMVYEGPVRAKGGGSGLMWAPDSGRISMDFGARTIVLDAGSNARPLQDLPGTDTCWIDARQIVMATAAGVERIDVLSRARQLIAPRARRPQCLDR
jgi:hypothetical protein